MITREKQLHDWRLKLFSILQRYPYKAVLRKVKDGQWEAWETWCTELNTTLREEALLTLKEEEVLQELALGFQLNDQHYVIGFMDGECLPANMHREINQKHNKMKKQCLERLDEAKILYNIKR